MILIFDIYTRLKEHSNRLFHDARFQVWSIIVMFLLITIHYYDDQMSFTVIAFPDNFLGITRHTIDRILYLVPIIFASFVLGARGGFIAVLAAFAAMAPRALFISASPTTALLETFVVAMIGSIVPLRIDYYERQGEKLELVMERLELTQRRLHSKVRSSMEQSKQLAVINSFSALLSQSLNVDQVMKTAINMVMEVLQVEVVFIYALDKNSGELRLRAFKGIQQESARSLSKIKPGKGLCGRVAITGQPMLAEDISNDPHLCNMTTLKENLKTQLSVPLLARGKIVGALCVATRSQRQFKDPEVEILSALGNLIGVAMDNLRLFHERERALERFKLSEKKYRQLFENAHDAIWVQDFSGKIIAANEAAALLFGRKLDELIGSDIKYLLSHEGLILSKEIQEDLLNGKGMAQPYTQRLVKKDGTEAVLMLTANLISSNGHPDGLQYIGKDITKEVKMQENERVYLKQITNAHEEERQRISRDLHDSTAQNLIASLHQLEELCYQDRLLPESSLRSLWGIHGQLKDSVQEIRRLSRDLRPSIIDDLGLLPSVEWLVEQLKNEHGIETTLEMPDESRRFSPEKEVALFRIVQEALRNIAKHSNASKVEVKIELAEAETIISIADNGKGFELPGSMGEFSRQGKLGIDGMQTRAKFVGGILDVRSEPGRGTSIAVNIPA